MAELALAVVGVAVAVPAVVEPIRYIREALRQYKTFDQIHSRLFLQLDMHLVQIENLAFFIYGQDGKGLAVTLDPTSRAVLNRVVTTLNSLLQDFLTQLSTALDVSGGRVIGRIRRLGFAFRGRTEPLKQLLKELESWERSFGNVVFSACLAAGRKLPMGLNGAVSMDVGESALPESSPQQAGNVPTLATPDRMAELTELIQRCCIVKPLPDAPSLRLSPFSREGFRYLDYSDVLYREGQKADDGSVFSPSYFLETRAKECDETRADANVRNIAAFLRGVNPRLIALLPCDGFSVEQEPATCCQGGGMVLSGRTIRTLVFRVPEGLSSPRSLRSLLIEARRTGVRHPLDERLALMKKLASALLFIHTADHIHKSIRADNVFLFQETTSAECRSNSPDASPSDQQDFQPESLGEPFLVGFDFSRHDASQSDLRPTVGAEKLYYLPVERQGDPTRRYTMLDDIYSLGVLLLEIGLWRSLFKFEEDPYAPSVDGRPNGRWVPTHALLDRGNKPLTPQKIKGRMVSLARKDVSRAMGTAVSGLIIACLTCLDKKGDGDEAAWTSFGNCDDLMDRDGILVGQAYIKKVIMTLDMVSM